MKIICVGRNYSEHAKELNNAIPEKPILFLKPQTALLLDDKDFYYPNFSKDVHFECELIFRICKNGKSISKKFAKEYYDAVSLGIDFTARDLQQKQKEKGLPWEIAKAFDHSAVVGKWKKLTEEEKENQYNFELKQNEKIVQQGNSEEMIFSLDELLAEISTYFYLNIGDIIFTGTPSGVGPISIGDKFEGFLENEKIFETCIK
ncbi:MAG: fumarylacetoacetate hydrolase family protein [Chitinophagaceae bacterium]|nr:fumarylacetoacetate hydrolase family protein [Chitinophagaceae bacterium]